MNRGGNFLLTKAVTKTASENRLTEAVTVTYNVTASVNHHIFRGRHIIETASVNSGQTLNI